MGEKGKGREVLSKRGREGPAWKLLPLHCGASESMVAGVAWAQGHYVIVTMATATISLQMTWE